ncbi:MAG: cytidine deaminase [Bacteroidaceae bacterium]|nr:cytidine deaminase [Bacteroidaceae bacterium]
MQTCSLIINYFKTTYEELCPSDQALIDAAKRASESAYAPYSKFNVGAAALLSNGEIVCGNNQENAAYPSGMCAERCAVFYANAQYPQSAITTLAIAASNTPDSFLASPITPCGACRQVLLESQKRFNIPMRLLLYGTKEVLVLPNVDALLPFQFNSKTLKSEK